MEVGDAAAWFAVAVALIAAFIALGNANSAKRQARAAERAVGEAQRSAAAAEQQAQAAQRQVEIMHAQLDDSRAEREARDGPTFEIERAEVLLPEHDGMFVEVTVKMISGPVLARVAANVGGEYLGLSFRPGSPTRPPIFENIRPGSKFTVRALRDECPTPIDGVVDLTCDEETGGNRTWYRSLGVRITQNWILAKAVKIRHDGDHG
ncbi:hypothetical protein [Saccharothrix texasensis]|uniref:Uncharacterized protein n=1 Tax=Saccharothrix texasensis TaxID=103734 RepID=A0A3N1H4I2_9PSEU|nr:hypothetical protein [Saccharothrix texasensis]ROP37425.1 hypothetical protein EDD40_2738 [Saccharothrix texasensis]